MRNSLHRANHLANVSRIEIALAKKSENYSAHWRCAAMIVKYANIEHVNHKKMQIK